MDPKRPARILLAPAAMGGATGHLPGRDEREPRTRGPAEITSFPSPEDHLVTPEVTRDEMIRGRRVIALPANPPHADRQLGLGYVIGAHVKPGYVGSVELLTRVSEGSDFATDVCVRKEGDDPTTGARYLEELSFEVVNEQRPRDIREKAEDLTARGVRRFIAVFVKTGKVCQWSREAGDFQALDLDSTIHDPCLSRPLRVRALLDAAEADDAVARALVDKRNPVIEAVKNDGRLQGAKAAIVAVLAARGLPVSADLRERIADCRDGATLERWIAGAAVAGSAAEALADEA